mgnify:CR=1 FL=1
MRFPALLLVLSLLSPASFAGVEQHVKAGTRLFTPGNLENPLRFLQMQPYDLLPDHGNGDNNWFG